MEEEKAEAVKGYNWRKIEHAVKVCFFIFLFLCSYPVIVSLVNAVTVCFDWFRWASNNSFSLSSVSNNYFPFRWVLNHCFLVVAGVTGIIYFFILPSFRETAEKEQPDLYEEYIAAVPTVVRSSPEYNYRVTEVEDDKDAGYNNNWSYNTGVEPVTAVKEYNCCDQVVMDANSKSYRRTRSEKKKETKTTTVEYRRTESERMMKTTPWRSHQSMDSLSSEDFRMTVETFITEKKMMRLHQNGVGYQQQNGGVDQWQHGAVDQWQNGAVNQLQHGAVYQLQNGAVNQWQNGVPLPQNRVVDQWRDGVLQWQGSRDKGSDRHRHRHRSRSSRSHRLEGGSGSTGSGPYLAISN